jgi:hypothetical protein
MSFTWPKDWQDWVSLFLGIWLCLSPWILHFTDDEAATNNVVLVGFIMIGAEVFTFSALRLVEELIDVALGAWLFISVWALALQLRFLKVSESMGNHDSKIVDAGYASADYRLAQTSR